MNLKIIIQLPEKIKDFLDDLCNDLYDDFKGRYWSKDQFFISLRDIDNVDEFSYKQIKSALYTIASKSDPFTLYCDKPLLLDPRRKSSLVYTLKGLTSKLYSLDQNIESTLYIRRIEREKTTDSPYIELAKKVKYKQLPYIKTPEIPIEVASIVLMEEKKTLTKVSYEVIEEYPLFGGQLFVTQINDDKVTCENSLGKQVVIDIMEMPIEIKEKDVIVKTGAQYTIDVNETRVRAIQAQIKYKKQK